MQQTNVKQTTLWLGLGAGFEYYDFVVFAYLAPFLSSIFFSEASGGLIATYMAYAVGYFARPFGAFIYGAVGDARGRRLSLLWVMASMSVATLGIGLLPSPQKIGLLSPILLFVFRFMQGVAFGAELPGSLTTMSEHSKEKKGYRCGLIISGVTLGSIMASWVVYLLSHVFSKGEIQEWAWRLPFLLGAILGFLNLWGRRYLKETPDFEKTERKAFGVPFKTLMASHKKSLFMGIGLSAIPAFLVTVYIYFPVFFSKVHGIAKPDIYLCLTIGLCWSVVMTPLWGRVGDSIGMPRLFKGAALLFIVSIYTQLLLGAYGFWGLAILCCLYQTFVSAFIVAYFPILTQVFPVEVRFTGVALSYNITYALISLMPMVFAAFPERNQGLVPVLLMVAASVSLVSARGLIQRPPLHPHPQNQSH